MRAKRRDSGENDMTNSSSGRARGESATGGDHLGGVLEAGVSDFCAGEHAGNFVGAGAVVKEADLHLGAAVVFALFNDEMLVAKAAIWGRWVTQRTCWPRLRALSFCPTASAARPPMPMSISSKTRVRGVGVLVLGLTAFFFDADFQGQHDAGHFAAGGDFVEGLEGLAGVGGDAVFDFVPAVGGPVRGFCRG
jgi:hypothetical protein